MVTGREIWKAILDARERSIKTKRPATVGIAGSLWKLTADKRDYRGLGWTYRATHPKLSYPKHGNELEIEMDIVNLELKWSNE